MVSIIPLLAYYRIKKYARNIHVYVCECALSSRTQHLVRVSYNYIATIDRLCFSQLCMPYIRTSFTHAHLQVRIFAPLGALYIYLDIYQ